jgi:hypothetical protein
MGEAVTLPEDVPTGTRSVEGAKVKERPRISRTSAREVRER